jgi:hypothetical protein
MTALKIALGSYGFLDSLERHLEGVYIGEKLISQLLSTLFEFSNLEHTDRIDFHMAHMELNLLCNGLYFDHNFFIRTPI